MNEWIYCRQQQPKKTGWYTVKFGGDHAAQDEEKWFNGEFWEDYPESFYKSGFGNDAEYAGDSWLDTSEQPK